MIKYNTYQPNGKNLRHVLTKINKVIRCDVRMLESKKGLRWQTSFN